MDTRSIQTNLKIMSSYPVFLQLFDSFGQSVVGFSCSLDLKVETQSQGYLKNIPGSLLINMSSNDPFFIKVGFFRALEEFPLVNKPIATIRIVLSESSNILFQTSASFQLCESGESLLSDSRQT